MLPAFIANMKLWLDANHSSASGATWTDRSSSGNDATKMVLQA